MHLIKLTDQYNRTMNATEWGDGVSHSGTGLALLCSEGVIHAYTTETMALLSMPAHVSLDRWLFRLWDAEGDVIVRDGAKVGCRVLTTTSRRPIPDWGRDSKTCAQISIRASLLLYSKLIEQLWDTDADRLLLQSLAKVFTGYLRTGHPSAVPLYDVYNSQTYAVVLDTHDAHQTFFLRSLCEALRYVLVGMYPQADDSAACALTEIATAWWDHQSAHDPFLLPTVEEIVEHVATSELHLLGQNP